MVDNPTKIYNDYVRANLPNSMSYDTGTDRYDINSHSFFKFKNSNWYFNYISKYGYSALSAYAVNNFEPALVFDFKGNYFRKSATASTFPASITHAASTNATMVDSDGLLKWRPHNVAKYSEDFTNAAWLIDAAGITKTATEITETATTTLHYTRQSMSVVGGRYTATVDLKPNGRQWAWMYADTLGNATAYFDLTNGVVGSTVGTGVTSSIIDLGDGYFRCTMSKTSALSANFGFGLSTADGTTSYLGDVTKSLFARKVHVYRSDLGGMVNNPDTANSYVPTTTAAVYLSRRGHHIYNGSAWVNEGILHESEARTNQMVHSGDLTGAGWTGGAIIGTATAGSPFGTYQIISPNSNNANLGPAQRYQIGKSITSGATYVGWALAKYSAGSGWFALNMYDTGKADEQAYFDVQNGVVGSKEALITDHGMVDYGDGWWLCWASSNAASGSGGLSLEVPNGDGVQSCTAADTILIAGSQFEQGSTPSSYIPTTSASVTRAAETLTVPAANLPWPTSVEATGTELVTNGTFDTDLTGWAAHNTATLSNVSGRLRATSAANYDGVYQSFPTVIGRLYRISFDVYRGTASTYRVGLGWRPSEGNNYFSGVLSSDVIGEAAIFVATHSNTYLTMRLDHAGRYSEIDNVSLKEVNPLALSIQIDGKMTYADNGVGATTSNNVGEVTFVKWQETSTQFIGSVLNTNTSRVGQVSVRQRHPTGGFDEVTSAVDAYTPDTNVPFNLAGRHGSTFINAAHEGTLLTANTTPTILPDLSATDLNLGSTFMGTIGEFRMWSDDLGDVGITEATSPSTEPSLSLTFDGSETSFIVLDWSE